MNLTGASSNKRLLSSQRSVAKRVRPSGARRFLPFLPLQQKFARRNNVDTTTTCHATPLWHARAFSSENSWDRLTELGKAYVFRVSVGDVEHCVPSLIMACRYDPFRVGRHQDVQAVRPLNRIDAFLLDQKRFSQVSTGFLQVAIAMLLNCWGYQAYIRNTPSSFLERTDAAIGYSVRRGTC